MSGESTQFVTDSANKGADIGGSFGPIGGIVGTVIGAIKGLYLSGKAKKVAKNIRLAQETKRKQQTMKIALQRRELVRSMRIARSQSVAAGNSEGNIQSSATMGASGSTASQGISALTYFDSQVGLDNEVQRYLKEAAKYEKQLNKHASNSGMANVAAELGSDIYGIYKTNEDMKKNDGTTYGYGRMGYTSVAPTIDNGTAMSDFNNNQNPQAPSYGGSVQLA